MKNNLNILFLITLALGTLIAISSTNWLGIWMGLELNMLSFIPLMISNKNILNNEAALKYFLIQAVASIIFISSALLNTLLFTLFNNVNFSYYPIFFMITSLLLKLGAAPFHNWFISIMPGLSWLNCFTLMTWQKISPLCIMTYLIFNQKLITIISILSLTTGSLGGLNQPLIKKILGFSSVSHLGWIFSTMLLSKFLFTTYFLLYMFMNTMIIWVSYFYNLLTIPQTFFSIIPWTFMINLLSLGGLPPFLGFLPKLLTLQAMIQASNLFLSFMLVMTSLITLFFYLRLIYAQMLFKSQQPNFLWVSSTWHSNFIGWLNMTTFFGLFLWNLI